MSTSIEAEFPGVEAAYAHFQAARSTEFFLCINTARIPLGVLARPGQFLYSTAGMNSASQFYSVEANFNERMLAPNAFSQNVLTDLLQMPGRGYTRWRDALTRVPMFSRIRKCEGLVDRDLAFEAVLDECKWLDNPTAMRKSLRDTDPYLGIYAPSPTLSSTVVLTAVPVQMPSFDLHFPVSIPQSVSIQQFAAFWAAIRTQFAQKTAAALTVTQVAMGDQYSVVFFGPPEQETTSQGCTRGCVASSGACEAPDRLKERRPEFSIGQLKKWRICPVGSSFEFSAIWRSIAALSEPSAPSRLEPMVLSLVNGSALPKSIHDFWRDKWSSQFKGRMSSPVGCTFARPSPLDHSFSEASIEVFISGDASDFFRLLFQPTICRLEQIRYVEHSRASDCIEIKVDVPPNTSEPSRKSVKMQSPGWEHFEVPANFPEDVHPANRLTPSQWEQLFTDRENGIVFDA